MQGLPLGKALMGKKEGRKMNNTTMTLDQALPPLGIKLARVYPASQAKVATRDLIIAAALKLLLLAFAYLALRVVFNKQFFPFMWDQQLYYKDILMIQLNPLMLLEGNEHYWSHNTLYSRMLGLIGILFWGMPPFIIAVALNLFFSFIIAIYVVKIYYSIVPESYINPRVIFYTIILSPILNAYTILILRDTMIVALFTMFIYYMMKNKYTGMFLVILAFLGLRPLMGLLCAMIYFSQKVTRWLLKFRLWWLYLAILIAVAWAALMMIGVERVKLAIMYMETMEGSDISKVFGMGFLDDDAAGVSGKAKLLIRLAAIDGIIVPALVYLTFIPSFRRSDRDMRIFLSMIVAMHFGVALIYISTLRSFPARKLQMLIPVFYAALFYYFNLRKTEKMQKLRARLLYLSQFRR